MKKDLNEEEWKKVRKILFSLYDLTWDYSELSARKASNSLEDSKPKRFENEPFRNYNQRLLNWDSSKTESYSRTFNEVKSKSFNLVKELEELLVKLGLPSKEE
ncbi:MAG: hypothetical protein IPM32_12515 [Ignavibacteriae bacterium]|nr:hypothetical protein [Ignavibacteriota bacterium]